MLRVSRTDGENEKHRTAVIIHALELQIGLKVISDLADINLERGGVRRREDYRVMR